MSLLFSVVVPTRGDPSRLLPLLDALSRQSFPRSRFEILAAFDGAAPDAAIAGRLESIGARTVASAERRGPGAARNRAAREARGDWLAFTEDDCVPADDWLERAAARLDGGAAIDVLEGDTLLPDGRPARRPGPHPHYLPTNLFVRRALFDRVGGYSEAFFDPASGIYFREDSDFGFTLEEAGARIARAPSARVVHPLEHPGWLDPLRWARRYEMDALLERRHPRRFRERIEVLRAGPFTFRRLFVRACHAYVLALGAAAVAALAEEPGLARWFLVLAAVAFVPVALKWRFRPDRLPVLLLVPPVLVAAHLKGFTRAARQGGAPPRA